MNDTGSSMLIGLAYWPRVNAYECRAIEQTLAPPSLLDSGLRLRGAVVEASYASSEPPLLDKLREDETPYVIDPQAVRFVSPSFGEVGALSRLPYAPEKPVTPQMDVHSFVLEALAFQNKLGASCYMVPNVWTPYRGEGWQRLNDQISRAGVNAIGSDVDHKPMIAFCAPDSLAMRDARSLLGPLSDLPFDGIYVQPTLLNPRNDSLEKLVRYVRFLLTATDLGLRVIAGRVGAFGLVLQALGINFFDSGLGEAESFSLAQLNKPRAKKTGQEGGGGRNRRVYIEPLKTTLASKDVDAILKEPELRKRFICTLPCCQLRGFEAIADRRRSHYLHVRTTEVEHLEMISSSELRLNRVHQDLQEAVDHSQVVTRTLSARSITSPSFDHLDRWIGVLSRLTGVHAAA